MSGKHEMVYLHTYMLNYFWRFLFEVKIKFILIFTEENNFKNASA